MVIATVINIEDNHFEGVIGYNKNNIGFLSYNKELNNILNLITDYDKLKIKIEENINSQTILLEKEVDLKDDMYIYGLMEYLPLPYKIDKFKNITAELENTLKNVFLQGGL